MQQTPSSTTLISRDEIARQISMVLKPEDEVVVLFSGIWMFGSLLGKSIKEVPAYLIDTILEALGPKRTLLLPAYTYGYSGSREFDLVRSKPETGILPGHALKRPEFKRTRSPLNSYLVTGPRTDEALAIQDKTLWGDESLMGWMDRIRARICVLGEPWHAACTHFHRVEEVLQVPYRYYKRFPGTILNDGKVIGECAPIMYVRPLNCDMMRDYTGPEKIMSQRNMILRGDNPNFPVESALAPDIVAACVELLSEDTYAYVENKNRLQEWVINEKAGEIAALKDEERVR